MISEANSGIALFGDSIAAGLGVRRSRYIDTIANATGFGLLDYSTTGSTVQDSLETFINRPSNPAIAIVAHGVTEPIIRPHTSHIRPFPARWHRRGWMDPRPYYSSRRRRRVFERCESEVRWRVKNWLISRSSYQLLSEEEYRDGLFALVTRLRAGGTQALVLGPPDIDERFFPGSNHEQERYARHAQEIAGSDFIDLRGKLHQWDDFLLDRFHPNDAGHDQIARIVLEHITKSKVL